MKLIPNKATRIVSGITVALLLAAPAAHADFFGDAQATINLRNFYYNRDNEGDKTHESWSQAAHLYLRSGYTEGPVGFGIDITGLGAVRLDGKYDDTANLPSDKGNIKDLDGYGRGGATLKMRLSNSELKVGLLQPINPVISRDFSRVLPQTFEGAQFTNTDVQDVKFTAGYLWRTSARHSSNQEKIGLGGPGGSIFESDNLSYFGVEVKWDDNWSSSYWVSRLENIYDQNYISSNFKQNLGDNIELFSSAFIYDTKNSGTKQAGDIDNQTYGLQLGLGFNGHKIQTTYQKVDGPTAFPTLGNATPHPYTFHWVTNLGFAEKNEESIQLRYDYDFSAIGIPGLTLMARYIRGSGIEDKAYTTEWERDTDIGYTFQGGPLKDLSFLLRTVSVRNPAGLSRQEYRFITSYPFNF